jgi:hypothetical protein
MAAPSAMGTKAHAQRRAIGLKLDGQEIRARNVQRKGFPMAEGSAPVAALAQATKAPMALLDFCKKYWWAGPFLLLLIMALGMAIKPWFVSKMTTQGGATVVAGDKLPAALRSFLRIAGFLVPVGYFLLSSDYAVAAVAACAGHIPCGTLEHASGWLGQALGYLLAIAGGPLAFGIVARLSAPDVLDCKTENNGRSLSYTPGAFQEVSLFMRTSTKNKSAASGRPLIATDITLAMDTTVEQVSTGSNPLLNQDLSRLLSYMEISTPFHGTILDKITGTGPMLDLVINFVGQGFGRSGDAPIDTITVPVSSPNDVAVTKYFTFPWLQRILEDSSCTCPWLKTLDNGELKIGIAASTALAAVSTGANSKSASALRAGIGYAVSPIWRQTYLPYARLDQPASGSDGLEFRNFGGTGPSSSKALDMVHTIGQLSNLAGLPGNLTFETVRNIIATSFGIDDVKNVDMLVKNRIDAQFDSRIGAYDFAGGGNHRQGTACTNGGMALDKLLFLFLRQASLKMDPRSLPKFDSNTRLQLREEFSAPRTGADAFIVMGYRELSAAKQAELSLMSGGSIPSNYAQARVHPVN